MTNQNPAFVAYALACCALILNQLVLWMMSGGVRGKSKTAVNPEDLLSIAKGSALVSGNSEPPEVARVMRVHANGQANILPFLFLGALFVQVGGPAGEAQLLFGVFTIARVLYSIIYMAGKQPWRTILFFIGLATTLALIVEVLRYLFS
jgi:uncharacterized MAPEG superfamily protein